MNNLLGVIDSIQKTEGSKPPCKKAVQKLVYLIQEAGTSLGYDFNIHFYGPYSSDLDAELRYLHSIGVLNIDKRDFGHLISVDASPTPDSLTHNVEKIISAFKDKAPSELELLTTALYVQRELVKNDSDSIVAGVTKIKGSKFQKTQIIGAIDELKTQQYFA